MKKRILSLSLSLALFFAGSVSIASASSDVPINSPDHAALKTDYGGTDSQPNAVLPTGERILIKSVDPLLLVSLASADKVADVAVMGQDGQASKPFSTGAYSEVVQKRTANLKHTT